MSETSLPFNETFYPSSQQIGNGKILKKEWQRSIENREEFWMEKAKAIDWYTHPTKALDDSNAPFYKWFPDGKLNITYNALDRHIKTEKKNKLAYIWEGEMGEVRTFSFYQLYREVNKLAKAFKDAGIKKGDRIAVYLPVIPELPITLLACARVGAIHTVVFSGFSADALAGRVNDSGARILVTADGSFRRGKTVAIKDNADRALPNCPTIEKVIVVKRTGQPVQMNPARDVWYNEALAQAGTNSYVE